MPYRIKLAVSALEDLRCFRKFVRVRLLDAMETQLTHEPTKETRKRRRLRGDVLASWELREGDYRVFYNVSEDEGIVHVTAVGHKDHNKLYVGKKEVKI